MPYSTPEKRIANHKKRLANGEYHQYLNEYRSRPEVKKHRAEYMRLQRQNDPNFKTYMSNYNRQYRQRPDVIEKKRQDKEKMNKYQRDRYANMTPEKKEKERARRRKYMINYNAREETRKRMKIYSHIPTVIERRRELDRRPERYAIAKKWRKINNFRHRRTTREWKRKKRMFDIQYVIVNRLRSRFNSALKLYGLGKTLPSNEYGIDYKAIIEHLGSMPQDGQKWEIDHIRPLSSFDLRDPEQIKIAWAPSNHQWLTLHDNRSKFNKIIEPKSNIV